jgi:hypothetical protein
MTENVFYPLFGWLVLALVAALDRPTLRRQLLVLALLVLLFLTRAQAVALVGAALTAPLALAWIERGRPHSLRAWKPAYALVALGVVAVAVWEVAHGRSVTSALGGYSVTGSAHYRFWAVLKWIVLHLAGLDLALWVLPAAATIVVVASARHLDRQLRVFAAVTASLVLWLVVEVGAFASVFSLRIEERNLFYLAPLLLIGLLAWIERGQPRPPRATVVGATVAIALAGTIPFLTLLNENSESDTPFLQPWWWLGANWTGRSSVAIVASLTALALAAAFLWLPARFAPWLPALVAAGFLVTWLPLEAWPNGFPQASLHQYDAAVAAGTSWIDRTVGTNANVAALWSGGSAVRYWENEFWNRSIRRVYALRTPLPGGMPQQQVTVQSRSGDLVDESGKPLDADYVLTDVRAQILGTRVAADPDHSLVLYRVTKPARIRTQITGWYGLPDLWTTDRVTWTRLECGGGTLRIPVYTDPGLFAGHPQEITVSGTTPTRVYTLKPSAKRVLVVPLTARAGRCVVKLHIFPSRIPANIPSLHSSDTRLLGIHAAAFEYRP